MSGETLTEAFDPKAWPWGTDRQAPQILHAMIRVRDLDRSLRFYLDLLGMKVLDRFELDSLTSMYVGFGDFSSAAIELEYDADASEPYSHGSGFGHISIGFPDLVGLMTRLAATKTPIRMQPARFFPNGPQIAMIEDPDGYILELVQTCRN